MTANTWFCAPAVARPSARSLSDVLAGRLLYLRLLGCVGTDATRTVRASATDQLQALARVDPFDEPAFRRASADLKRLHPVPGPLARFVLDTAAVQPAPQIPGMAELRPWPGSQSAAAVTSGPSPETRKLQRMALWTRHPPTPSLFDRLVPHTMRLP